MKIKDILNAIKKNEMSIDEAEKLLSLYAIEHIEDIAKLDINREVRRGVPEVIYAENKSFNDIRSIALRVLKKNDYVIISRVKDDDLKRIKNALKGYKMKIGKYSNTVLAYKKEFDEKYGPIGILTAGTSDIKVAEEAEFVLTAMNCKVIKGYDVGVAGIHRLFPILKEMIANDVDAIIVIAGMEGALASVVASLVDIPVIGVPTSIGYGFGSNGYGALASMLQSCSFGLAVMNIDNGIGAGAFASLIAKRVKSKSS
jgi:hypothetical protein